MSFKVHTAILLVENLSSCVIVILFSIKTKSVPLSDAAALWWSYHVTAHEKIVESEQQICVLNSVIGPVLLFQHKQKPHLSSKIHI